VRRGAPKSADGRHSPAGTDPFSSGWFARLKYQVSCAGPTELRGQLLRNTLVARRDSSSRRTTSRGIASLTRRLVPSRWGSQ
jgi:hypothetical protein